MLGPLAGGLLFATVVAFSGVLHAASVKPEYLRYAAFAPQDTAAQIAVKQAYNEAVVRYNQALYEYHVTLEQHDQLVEIYNGSANPAERQQARDQATPLRAKLATLRREVTSLARGVDEAARRAAAAGVPITR